MRAQHGHERMLQFAGRAQLSPSLAALVIFRNSLRTCHLSSGVPSSRQNTRSCSCHISPPRAVPRPGECGGRGAPGPARVGNSSTRRLLRVFVSPLTRTDRYTATVPSWRSTSPHKSAHASSVRTPGQQGQHHVGRKLVRSGFDCLYEYDGLVERHRSRRPSFLPLRHVDQS